MCVGIRTAGGVTAASANGMGTDWHKLKEAFLLMHSTAAVVHTISKSIYEVLLYSGVPGRDHSTSLVECVFGWGCSRSRSSPPQLQGRSTIFAGD